MGAVPLAQDERVEHGWPSQNHPMTCDPVGSTDIADRLGVQPQTVAMWRYRGVLPEPSWFVSGMPVWNWPDVVRWAKETGRL